jgi:hypothetical protein
MEQPPNAVIYSEVLVIRHFAIIKLLLNTLCIA